MLLLAAFGEVGHSPVAEFPALAPVLPGGSKGQVFFPVVDANIVCLWGCFAMFALMLVLL
jgi:hypothetical protein